MSSWWRQSKKDSTGRPGPLAAPAGLRSLDSQTAFLAEAAGHAEGYATHPFRAGFFTLTNTILPRRCLTEVAALRPLSQSGVSFGEYLADGARVLKLYLGEGLFAYGFAVHPPVVAHPNICH